MEHMKESKFIMVMDKIYEYPKFVVGVLENEKYILFRRTQALMGPYNEIDIKHNTVIQLRNDMGYTSVSIEGEDIRLDSLYGYIFESNPLAEYIAREVIDVANDVRSTDDIEQLILAGQSWRITTNGIYPIQQTARIRVNVIKLWEVDYTHVIVLNQEGLWNNKDNKWEIPLCTQEIEIKRYIDDVLDRGEFNRTNTPLSRLDYILIKHSELTYVVENQFNWLGSLDKSMLIKRIARRKWAISKQKYDNIEIRTDINETTDTIQNKSTVKLNGVTIVLQGLSYRILDSNEEAILANLERNNIMDIITLDGIDNKIFRKCGQEVYEITELTQASDSLEELKSSMEIVSDKEVIYNGVDYMLTSIAPYQAMSRTNPGKLILYGLKRENVECTIY